MLHVQPLPADTDLLALHRQAPLRYPLLMESVASGTVQGRWDLLLAANGEGLQLHGDGITRDLAGTPQAGTFLQALDAAWRDGRTAAEEPRWPFHGGWALLLDYELAAQVETVLELPRRAAGGRPPGTGAAMPGSGPARPRQRRMRGRRRDGP